MTFITKGYVNLLDGQVHYRLSGHGSSIPLVMLHQTASSSVMYEQLMSMLTAFHIIAPDTPGYGESFDPQHKPTIAYYAEIVHQLFNEMNIGKCYLFGHHTGSAIAVQFCHDYPERVEKLILGGPPHLTEQQKQALKQTLSDSTIPHDGSHLTKVWGRIRSTTQIENLQLVQRETLLTLRASRYHESYQAVFEQDFAGLLAHIHCPTLIVCGEHDTIRASAEPTHSTIPMSELIIVPEAGTYICDEHPEELAQIIRQFINDT